MVQRPFQSSSVSLPPSLRSSWNAGSSRGAGYSTTNESAGPGAGASTRMPSQRPTAAASAATRMSQFAETRPALRRRVIRRLYGRARIWTRRADAACGRMRSHTAARGGACPILLDPFECADATVTQELATIVDFIRYGASRFGAAGLTFGHSYDNALDEATHLVLHALHLPHDLSPAYGQARLIAAEKQAVLALIDRRVDEHRPVA